MAKKASIKKKTIEIMKALGVYKQEYDPIIEVYAELNEQYQSLTKQFKKSGYKHYETTMQGGTKKASIVATLESLRKDLLLYSDRLCLNPKSIETVTTDQPSKSKLAKVLSDLQCG
ncbi:MAG TPA: terminase [Peptococcaceae bacterium]|nr:terminase [Peptococcaceae bacterium]